MKWDDMNVGDLVKDCSFFRKGRDDDHVGIIVKENKYEYTTSDSVTEYHNIKYRYDVFWQNPPKLEYDVDEHDIELYETWLAEQTGEKILASFENELSQVAKEIQNDKK